MENTQTKLNGFKIAAYIEAAVIIAFIAVLVINSQKADILIDQIETGRSQKDSIAGELSKMMVDYDALKTDNDTINAQLVEQRAKVEQLMVQLRRTKASNAEQIEQYKNEVESLRKIMRSFVVQIDSLNQKNIHLLAENAEIKNDYNKAAAQNKELSYQKDSLQGRVKQAETLKATGLQFVALNDRDNPTNRVFKVKKFQITFTLNENDMAATGNKTLYLRLAKPDGAILVNESTGFFNFEGKELAYSAVKNVNFDGKAQSTTIYVISREVLNSGNYQADIFCDGRRIGVSSTVLQ